MDGLFLLLGHMVGDYVLQNDWMAQNKANPHPGPEPHPGRIGLGCGPAPKREYPGPRSVDAGPDDREAFRAALEERDRKVREWDEAEALRLAAYMENFNAPDIQAQREWWARRRAHRTGALACLCHCALYTLAVWAFSFAWMPWWGLAVCFLSHYALDRWRLAGRWMRNVAGQGGFASGPLSPWSVVVVDNTFHLLTLGVIAALAGKWPAY